MDHHNQLHAHSGGIHVKTGSILLLFEPEFLLLLYLLLDTVILLISKKPLLQEQDWQCYP